MNKENQSMADLIRIEGVNARGFGTIPKSIMKDRRLTPTAKLIYAYFCSYAGAGNQAFPGRQTILKDLRISKDTYYRHFNMLKECDYIRIEQKKTSGRFVYNIYTLVPCPAPLHPTNVYGRDREGLPCPKFSDTVNKDMAVPCPGFSDTEIPDTKSNKNNKIYNNLSTNLNTEGDMGGSHERMIDWIDEITQTVKRNIEYDLLVDDKCKALADSIVTLIVDVLAGKAKSYRINGNDVPAGIVRERLLELNGDDFSYVLCSVERYTQKIRNHRNYLLTTLFNAPASSELFWKTEIANVMAKYAEKNGGRKPKAQTL